MKLARYLKEQQKLQTFLGSPMGQGEGAIKENILALIVEATELLNEFNWKCWKATQHKPVRAKVSKEIIDIMKFYCNILNEIGITETEFDMMWNEVHEQVKERFKNGY